MKKVQLWGGGIILAVIVAYAAHAAYVLITIDGPALDRESKAWVDEILPQILTTWDSQAITKHASSEWLASVPADENERYAVWARENIGTLTKYGTSTGESGIHINNFSSKITAEYVVEADFTKGHARVFIQGVMENDEWKIFMLHVDTNPNLRWWNGHLTEQAPLENVGESQTVDGVTYKKIWNW